MVSKKESGGTNKILLILLILFALATFFLILDKNNSTTFSLSNIINNEESKKTSLEEFYLKYTKLVDNEDYTAEYELLIPEDKGKITLEEYIDKQKSSAKSYNDIYTVNNVEIRDNVGIVDRIRSYCLVQDCAESERISVSGKKKFIMIDNKWLTYLDNNVYCDRSEPYPNPPEFDRALSLIIQRFQQSTINPTLGMNSAKQIESIKNCLDIQYALSESEMDGAEGLFSFSSNSTKDRLKILVSPRYQIKDDLLTAILLSHELKHARLYATDEYKSLTCYGNEVNAFKFQLSFIAFLNKEEMSSLTTRYFNTNSLEVGVPIDLIGYVGRSSPVGPYTLAYDNKILNYIKSIPGYQEECKNSEN